MADFTDEDPSATANTIHDYDDRKFTGLLDAEGNKIFRERQPVGFRIGK